ncbi:MFS transporter [Macrococcoides caseolyticum subsp. hominis]|uniref:MFS transporter n=1 Tax=Macrococcoides caseolyticum TaxID=69966 RepID=UPI000C14A8DE|nr:MFS transporter [Macrococcus caseolyticus]RAI80237.1 MFS transporter [Macrococcus caseolyticus subsp. hominis]
MKRGLISALVIIMFMSAIETSIVSLATPAIGKDLGVKESLALIFTSYMIAIVVITPLVGEIMKRIGSKYTMIFGIIVFIVGSMLSGASFTFPMLVASRLVQGLGAGIMMTMGSIIPKIAFEIPYRYKVMGIVGSVWGISSIVGPLLGGLILTYLRWSFLFYINVPVAIVAIVLVLKFFKFDEQPSKEKLDVKGLLLFYAFLSCLIIGFTAGGLLSMVAYIVAITLLVIFVKFELKVQSPFIPVRSFNKRIGITMGTDMVYAMLLMGTNIFLPFYLQTEKGLSPLLSGLTTFSISVFWLTSTFILKRIEQRFTVKQVYQLSFFYMIIGAAIILVTESVIAVTIGCIFLGLSYGTVFTKNVVTIQESAAPHELGSMMSTYSLLRFIGSTTGSIVMSFVYYSNVLHNIHNNMAVMVIIALILITIYQFVYREKTA